MNVMEGDTTQKSDDKIHIRSADKRSESWEIIYLSNEHRTG